MRRIRSNASWKGKTDPVTARLKNMSRSYISIDLGATNGRICVGRLTPDGTLSINEVHRFRNVPLYRDRHIYWDLPGILSEIEQGMIQAVSNHPGCVSIACDSWALDHGFLDHNGKSIGLPHSYLDHRTHNFFEKIRDKVPLLDIYERTSSALIPFATLGQLFTTFHSHPEYCRTVKSFLFICDLVHDHLCGVKACEISLAGASQIFSLRDKDWDRDLIHKAGLPEGIFPPVNSAGTILGQLSPSIRQKLNIPDLQVIQSVCHDTASAIAAAPLRSRKDLVISAGTWSMMGLEVDQPVKGAKAMGLVCGPYPVPPNRLFLLRGVMGLYLLERFMKELTVNNLDEILDSASVEKPFQCLFQPDHPLFAGQGSLSSALAEWCGMTDQPIPPTPGGIVRSLLESLALCSAESVNILGELAGYCPERIVMVGGGSRNRLLNQFIANATGLAVHTGVAEAATAGNLLYQAIALGDLPGPESICEVIRNSFHEDIYAPSDQNIWKRAFKDYQQNGQRFSVRQKD